MGFPKTSILLMASALLALSRAAQAGVFQEQSRATTFNVRTFGAKGDGVALDSEAINRAIGAAASQGGGTVWIPAGTYSCVSIHLQSHVAIFLDRGAKIVAAKRSAGVGYDPAESNPNNKFQDFGHSYFHNSLIWGERLTDIAITGGGEIFGEGLVSDYTKVQTDGNKSIALRECKKVLLRDFTIRHGGWFGILATGVDQLTVDNLVIDTNRDGMDIDGCRDVHVSNCSVNSPHDDGICLKSSFPLGEFRPCENVTITNCHVSGFQEGSLLDHTYVRKGYPTGRIKFGTESNGGFKNIAISNCVFDYSRGLALETVDGGLLEDVTISNITMRDIVNAPIFLRLGSRMRGPEGTPIGKLRRISLSNIRIFNALEASIIAGIPGNPIEDVTLSNIRVWNQGGAPAKQGEVEPPEQEKGYPEPGSLGKMPASGFFVRHAKRIEFFDVEIRNLKADLRSPFVVADTDGLDFFQIKADREPRIPFMRSSGLQNLRLRFVDQVRDREIRSIGRGDF